MKLFQVLKWAGTIVASVSAGGLCALYLAAAPISVGAASALGIGVLVGAAAGGAGLYFEGREAKKQTKKKLELTKNRNKLKPESVGANIVYDALLQEKLDNIEAKLAELKTQQESQGATINHVREQQDAMVAREGRQTLAQRTAERRALLGPNGMFQQPNNAENETKMEPALR